MSEPVSGPVAEANAEKIAMSRKRQVMHAIGNGAMRFGYGAMKFLMPHGVYKAGKKVKKKVKHYHQKYQTAKELYGKAKEQGLIT